MAAPQWSGGKCKSVQQVKAFFRHNDKERREEMHHRNWHIDKSKTKENFTYRGLSYEQLCKAFDTRLASVDVGRQSSGKNARVLLQSVIVYPPAALVDDKAKLKDWFMDAGRVFESRFGENFLDMQVDFDENHEYPDADTGEKRMSLEHGHVRLFPEVDGKLNGKAFCTRKVINELNLELNQMSLDLYGVPMMDGTKRKGGAKVEDLKVKSEAMEIIKKAEKEAERIRMDAQADADRQKAALEARRRVLEEEEGRRASEWETVLEGLRRARKAADDEKDLAGAIVRWAESKAPKVVDKLRGTLSKADAAGAASKRMEAAVKRPRSSHELDATFEAATVPRKKLLRNDGPTF